MKEKLDEKSILKRLSDGTMFQVTGGSSSHFTSEEVQPSLGTCLAGCGCNPHRACDTCQASV